MGDRWATCTTGAGCKPTRESQNPQSLGVRFSATLGEEPEVEVALV